MPNAIQTMNFIKELGEKCIIFTEYKATQIYLQWLLHQHGLLAVTYNGDFRKSKNNGCFTYLRPKQTC